MISVIYFIGIALFLFPAIIFLDFNKKNNVYIGVIYLIVFVFVVFFVLPWLIATPDRAMAFAMSIPFLMAAYLIIAKKNKKQIIRKENKDVIDDLN